MMIMAGVTWIISTYILLFYYSYTNMRNHGRGLRASKVYSKGQKYAQ